MKFGINNLNFGPGANPESLDTYDGKPESTNNPEKDWEMLSYCLNML